MKSFLLIGIAVSISFLNSVYAAPQNKNTRLNLNDLDINADGVISFLEFQESDKNGLSGLDIDEDGFLTLEEVLKSKPGARRSGKSLDQEDTMIFKLFKKIDTDFDSFVTLAEFQDAKFDKMDSDNDGVLSKEELRPKHKIPSKMRPKRPDTDGDGVISFAEFQENHKSGLSEHGIAKFDSLDLNSDGFLSNEELDKGHTRPKGSLHPNHNNYQYKDQPRQRSKRGSNMQWESRPNASSKEK